MYLLINASPNKDGNTAFLLGELKRILDEKEVRNKYYDLSDALDECRWSYCTNCTSPCSKACYLGTKLHEIYNELTEADGVVFGSPVYFGHPTAQLKTFFDKSTSYRKQWVGKKISAITTGGSAFGGQETTANAIYQMGLVHGMEIINDGVLALDAGHYGVQAQAPTAGNEFAIARTKLLGERLASIV